MFFPNRTTGGKDTFRVSCGTPTTRSLVLFGLINKEFVEYHFVISRRSPLKSEMATLMSNGGRAKSSLVSPTYIAHGFALIRYREKVVEVQCEQNWTENGPLGHTHCQWEGSDRSLPILTTCLRNDR